MLGAEKAHRPHARRHQAIDHVDQFCVHAGGMAEHAHPPAPAQIKPFRAKDIKTRSDCHNRWFPPAL
jgi:hypothetical protein